MPFEIISKYRMQSGKWYAVCRLDDGSICEIKMGDTEPTFAAVLLAVSNLPYSVENSDQKSEVVLSINNNTGIPILRQ